jgi:hypothetical protein
VDGEAVVDRIVVSAGAVEVEQAIFTSIRSPMGQGYRLVAVSSGIATDEKREIVQRAPSHGSLCDPSPTATGLASYHLSSGRRCIFFSRNAGIEQTARGGCRVHTHVLVLEPGTFRRFKCDPLALEAVARLASDTDSGQVPPVHLERLRLLGEATEAVDLEPGVTPSPATADRAVYILSAVLAERRTLVVGVPTPRQVLGLVLGATPMAAREQLSLSYGLKFSPSRGFQLIFAEADRGEAELIVHDHEIDLFRWDLSPPQASSPFAVWLRFARQCWLSGRADEINGLAAQLARRCSADALERIAALHTAIERLRTADLGLVDRLVREHAWTISDTEAHAGLLDRFRAAVVARRADLEEAARESSAADQAPN